MKRIYKEKKLMSCQLIDQVIRCNNPDRPREMGSIVAKLLDWGRGFHTTMWPLWSPVGKQLFVLLTGEFLGPDGPAWTLYTSYALLWLPFILPQQHRLLEWTSLGDKEHFPCIRFLGAGIRACGSPLPSTTIKELHGSYSPWPVDIRASPYSSKSSSSPSLAYGQSRRRAGVWTTWDCCSTSSSQRLTFLYSCLLQKYFSSLLVIYAQVSASRLSLATRVYL